MDHKRPKKRVIVEKGALVRVIAVEGDWLTFQRLDGTTFKMKRDDAERTFKKVKPS